ncbi:Thymocyte nuclear protein 1 [Actinomortierella ambigua]|uniref:Thymocyte nuclear protein 1 n=1 Tax=Actinomortierella ambigua TaxID=1343610 RepID=A0A9P6QFJ1_9FUNG|nr:Thymocyte nuclear protein 1 [Actinomortierella ambigua]
MRRSNRIASKATDLPPPLAAHATKRSIGTNGGDGGESDAVGLGSSPKRSKQVKQDHAVIAKKETQKELAGASASTAAAGTTTAEPIIVKAKGKTKKDPPASQLDDRKEGETKIWLMKAEPDSRVVKGKDVKFSIDDLAAMPNGTSPWDGVRNHEAKNIMRYRMKVGDTVLFYHSNTKTPGIAGIAEVAKEAYPDYSAFDPKHPYYDEKSDKDDPRWYMVDVKFKRKLKRLLSLKELQEYKDKELKNMPLLNRGRLSVQPVHQSDLDFILELEQRPAADELS